MRRIFVTAVVAVFAAVLAPGALAATATPFGGATVNDGILTLVSNTGDAGSTNDASGATFSDTGVTTFSSITQLSAEFNVTDDDCLSGSPRFQIRVDTPSAVEDKNVFVYLDPTPTASGGCAVNTWLSTGNLIGSTTNGQYDTSQIQPGTQVTTYAQALALVGTYPVTGISLVVDSGWAFTDKEQTVLVRNVRVNTSTFYMGETTPPSQRWSQPGPGLQAAAHRDGCDGLPAQVRHEPKRRQRLWQVCLGDGPNEERQRPRGSRHEDRRRGNEVRQAHNREERQGQGQGTGKAGNSRGLPEEDRLTPTNA